MGRFDFYSNAYEWISDGVVCRSKEYDRTGYHGYEYVTNFPYGKYHWFAIKKDERWVFKQVKSVPKNKLISCLDNKCTSQYAEIFDVMEGCYNYSPYDPSKDVECDMTLEEFLECGIKKYGGRIDYHNFKFISSHEGSNKSYLAESCYGDNKGKYNIKRYELSDKDNWCLGYSVGYNKIIINHMTLEEIFEIVNPKYTQRYLANGRKYEKRYSIRYE